MSKNVIALFAAAGLVLGLVSTSHASPIGTDYSAGLEATTANGDTTLRGSLAVTFDEVAEVMSDQIVAPVPPNVDESTLFLVEAASSVGPDIEILTFIFAADQAPLFENLLFPDSAVRLDILNLFWGGIGGADVVNIVVEIPDASGAPTELTPAAADIGGVGELGDPLNVSLFFLASDFNSGPGMITTTLVVQHRAVPEAGLALLLAPLAVLAAMRRRD